MFDCSLSLSLEIERKRCSHHSRFDRVFYNADLRRGTGGIGILIGVGYIVSGQVENIEQIEFQLVFFVFVPRTQIDDAGIARPVRTRWF